MDDLQKRIRRAVALLEEECATVVLIVSPIRQDPVVVFSGEPEQAWALAKLAERKLKNESNASPQL